MCLPHTISILRHALLFIRFQHVQRGSLRSSCTRAISKAAAPRFIVTSLEILDPFLRFTKQIDADRRSFWWRISRYSLGTRTTDLQFTLRTGQWRVLNRYRKILKDVESMKCSFLVFLMVFTILCLLFGIWMFEFWGSCLLTKKIA